MQKINSIQSYKLVVAGQSVAFMTEEYLKDQPRMIKLAINSPSDALLYATNMDEQFDPKTGEMYHDRRLIAFVRAGFEQIEMSYLGNFILDVEGADIWLFTFDAADMRVASSDDSNYAVPYERQEVDPILQQIQYLAKQNERQRQADRAADIAAYEERLAAILKAKETPVVPPAPNPAPAAAPGAAPVGSAVGSQGDPATGGTTDGTNGGEPKADG